MKCGRIHYDKILPVDSLKLLAFSYHLIGHEYDFVETSQEKRHNFLFEGF